MSGRAAAKNTTWNRKEAQRRSRGRLKQVKNRPLETNAIFGPLETNGRADGNQTKASFTTTPSGRNKTPVEMSYNQTRNAF